MWLTEKRQSTILVWQWKVWSSKSKEHNPLPPSLSYLSRTHQFKDWPLKSNMAEAGHFVQWLERFDPGGGLVPIILLLQGIEHPPPPPLPHTPRGSGDPPTFETVYAIKPSALTKDTLSETQACVSFTGNFSLWSCCGYRYLDGVNAINTVSLGPTMSVPVFLSLLKEKKTIVLAVTKINLIS